MKEHPHENRGEMRDVKDKMLVMSVTEIPEKLRSYLHGSQGGKYGGIRKSERTRH